MGKPIPSGWFCVGITSDLANGDVRALRYFGRDLVLLRTDSGQVRLLDAHCPHNGAHLGVGGTIEGESIRCPFHGFCFDTGTGECKSTPYGLGPPKGERSRVRGWPVRDVNGVILAYYSPARAEPTWEIPSLDHRRWSRLYHRHWEGLRATPEEAAENSVDAGHFTQVHNFQSARITKDVECDGPLLTISYEIEAQIPYSSFRRPTIRVLFDIEVRGLGYSLVRGHIPALKSRFHNYVLTTPVDEGMSDLRVCTIAEGDFGPLKFLQQLVGAVAFMGLKHEVSQDFEIWANKTWVERPALAKGDGPIGRYRKWARQFYEEPSTAPLVEIKSGSSTG